MKTLFLCLLYFLFTPVGSQKPTSESELHIAAIKKPLSDFSLALASADTVSLKYLTGPTFILLEEGRTFDFQAMIPSIQQIFAPGTNMKRFPSNSHTEIRGLVA